MKLLLDTHTYLWAINDASMLSATAKQLIDDLDNDLYLSIASLWEATIKITIRKLIVPGMHVDFLTARLAPARVTILPISPAHLSYLQTLPFPVPKHRDPFDRILIAQSVVEEFPIVTVDQDVRAYEVQTLW